MTLILEARIAWETGKVGPCTEGWEVWVNSKRAEIGDPIHVGDVIEMRRVKQMAGEVAGE